MDPSGRGQVWNRLIAATKKTLLKRTSRFDRLSEFQSEILARLFLESVAAQTAHRCDGQCGTHYCVGESLAKLVLTLS